MSATKAYECPECGGEAYLATTEAYGMDTDTAACLECEWEWSEGSGEDLPEVFWLPTVELEPGEEP